eukprot:1157727-Pelagomonas_calceolata.AAC.2
MSERISNNAPVTQQRTTPKTSTTPGASTILAPVRRVVHLFERILTILTRGHSWPANQGAEMTGCAMCLLEHAKKSNSWPACKNVQVPGCATSLSVHVKGKEATAGLPAGMIEWLVVLCACHSM